MPDEIRINRSQGVSSNQPAMRAEPQMAETMPSQSPSKMPWIVLAAVVVVIIILGVLFRGKLFGGSSSGAAMSAASMGTPSGYQAVFLTNGQVYFGKINNVDGDYVNLTDIFYLQVGPQQGSGQSATSPTQTANQQQQISLVKLGNELHGPVDLMHINRSQILFYEDLKSDGQVVKAIMAYKQNPSGTAAPAAQPAPAAPTAPATAPAAGQ